MDSNQLSEERIMIGNQIVYPDQEAFVSKFCIFSITVLPALQLIYLAVYALNPDIFAAFPTSQFLANIPKFSYDYTELSRNEGEIVAKYFNTYNLILTISSTIISTILALLMFIVTIFFGKELKNTNNKLFVFLVFGLFGLIWLLYFDPTPYRFSGDGGRLGISLNYFGMFILAGASSILNLLMIVIFIYIAKILISASKLLGNK